MPISALPHPSLDLAKQGEKMTVNAFWCSPAVQLISSICDDERIYLFNNLYRLTITKQEALAIRRALKWLRNSLTKKQPPNDGRLIVSMPDAFLVPVEAHSLCIKQQNPPLFLESPLEEIGSKGLYVLVIEKSHQLRTDLLMLMQNCHPIH